MDKTTRQRVLQALSNEIEHLRRQLYDAANNKQDNFLDSGIIQLSQRLDMIIVEYEQLKKDSI